MSAVSDKPYLLALNAAEGLLQAVLAGQEGDEQGGDGLVPVAVAERDAPSQGAELLVPLLRDMLAEANISPAAVRRIAAVRGPGSFTGLRLALATASGLSKAIGAEQAGLDYLPLLALSALLRLRTQGSPTPARLWAVTHARRDLVHMQGFAPVAGPSPQRAAISEPLSDVLVCSPEQAMALVSASAKAGDGPECLFGSGVTRHREAFAGWLQKKRQPDTPPLLLEPEYDHPLPEALLRAASTAAFTLNDIEPLYIRPSDAEENLEGIAAALGLDPQSARNRLNELQQQH